MDSTRNLDSYINQLNKYTSRVAKLSSFGISRELANIDQMIISPYEKELIRGNLYSKLTKSNKKKLRSSFGNLTPASSAALATQPAPLATQAAAVMQQPQMQMQPQLQQQPQMASNQIRITPGGVQQVTDYNTAAGAINAASSALQAAGNQLQLMAATQNLSGFGRRWY